MYFRAVIFPKVCPVMSLNALVGFSGIKQSTKYWELLISEEGTCEPLTTMNSVDTGDTLAFLLKRYGLRILVFKQKKPHTQEEYGV